MTDLEDQLTRELGQVAGARPAPHVDLPGVRRVAQRERRRSRVVVAAVAAAVVGVIGLGGVTARLVVDRVDGGLTADGSGLLTGPPLALPWLSEGGALHLEGGVIAVREPVQVVHRGGTTLVGEGDPEAARWSLVRGAPSTAPALRPLAGRILGSPAVSTGGRQVAWVEDETVGLEVHVVDTASGAESTAVVPAGPDSQEPARLASVDDSGRTVLVRGEGAPLLVSPGGSATEVDAAGDGLLLLPSGRAVVTSRGGGSTLVALADDGSTTALDAPAPGPGSAVNPDGTAVVGAGGSPELVSIAADGSVGDRAALPLPHDDGQEWVVAGWESTTDVVLRDMGSGKRLSLVRCSTEADRCERVRSDGVQAVAD